MSGDNAKHDQMVMEKASSAAKGVDLFILAQAFHGDTGRTDRPGCGKTGFLQPSIVCREGKAIGRKTSEVTLQLFEKGYLIPLIPLCQKGGNVLPPFGKGRWGGILRNLFQTAKINTLRLNHGQTTHWNQRR
jgi:hypothetical protein